MGSFKTACRILDSCIFVGHKFGHMGISTRVGRCPKFEEIRIARTRCSMLQTNVLDSVRMRDVSKVITVTVGGTALASRVDSVAA